MIEEQSKLMPPRVGVPLQMGKETMKTLTLHPRGFDIDAPLGEPVEDRGGQVTFEGGVPDCLVEVLIEPIYPLGDPLGSQGGQTADISDPVERQGTLPSRDDGVPGGHGQVAPRGPSRQAALSPIVSELVSLAPKRPDKVVPRR
jgi:hypothetical protein